MSGGTYNVDIRCTAIPDGIVERDGKQMLRLSVLLAPVSGEGGDYDLRVLPRQLAAAQGCLTIWFNGHKAAPFKIVQNWPGDGHALTSAAALWYRIFSTMPDGAGGPTDGFAVLWCICGAPGDGKKVGRHKVDPSKLTFTLHKELAECLHLHKTKEHSWRYRNHMGAQSPSLVPGTAVHRTAQRPYRDPAVVHRRSTAEALAFSDRRSHAIGRLSALQAHKNEVPPARTSASLKKSLLDDLSDFARTGTSSKLEILRGRPQERSVSSDLLGYLELKGDFPDRLLKHALLQELSHPIEKIKRPKLRKDPDFPKAVDSSGHTDTEELNDAARRKLVGIRSYPTLARYLGLIVDVEIPLDAAGVLGSSGLVAASLDQTAAFDSLDKTFYSYGSDRFVPGSEGDQYACAIDDGVVKFKSGRYTVEPTNPTQLLQSLLHQSGATLEGDANGAQEDSLSSKFPETRSQGLQILDARAPERVRSILNKPSGGGDPITYHAETLCVGYRLDVRRARNGEKPMPWRSLMARKVTLPEVWDAFNIPGEDHHPYPDFRDRDHGVIRVLTKLTPTPGSDDNKGVAATQVLATWTGDHLGVPADGSANDAAQGIDEYRDLGTDVRFDFSGEEDDIAPALRYGNSYEFGMRAVMPNGSSITLRDASCNGYLDPTNRLGSCTYRPVHDVAAPAVLLPDDDALAQRRTKNSLPNELVTRIVLRTGTSARNDRVRRALVPCRLSFEQAEKFGLLDEQRATDRLRGAMRDFVRDFATGSFPCVRNGHIGSGIGGQEVPVGGTVISLRSEPGTTEPNPYFPDPLGRRVSFAFERNGKTPAHFCDTIANRQFWDKDNSPLEAVPIMLEARASNETYGGSFGDSLFGVFKDGYLTPHLVANIAKGETVTLWYWAWPDGDRFADTHYGSALYQNELATLSFSIAERHAKLEKFLSGTPFNGVSCFGKIDIVHAVEKPVGPLFVASLPASVVRLDTANKWECVVAAAAEILQIPSDVGGAVAYFTGTIAFHRNSTVALRCEAAWQDFSASAALARKVDGSGWTFKPANTIKQLFNVQGIPIDCDAKSPSKNDEHTFDIAYDETGAPRALNQNFHDGVARRLALRIVGTSRFTEDFLKRKDDPTQFERESRPAFRKDHPIDFNHASVWMLSTARPPKPVVDRIAWVTREEPRGPSNASGKKTVATTTTCHPRIYLSPPWFTTGEDEALALIFTADQLVDDVGFQATDPATAEPPCYLPLENPTDRGWPKGDESGRWQNFPASGKDTLNVFAPPPDPNNPLAGAGAHFQVANNVCRWGADPTTDTMINHPLEAMMPPERFSGHVARVENLLMPISHPPPPGAEEWTDDPKLLQPVSALIYRPKFDEETGMHYVDIDIDPGHTHMPFVRLSLARFQPHSAQALFLSTPLVLDPIQIPASRTVTVSADASTGRLDIEVTGHAFRNRRPEGIPAAPNDAKYLTPLMNVRVMREADDGKGLVQLFDERGEPVSSPRTLPDPVTAMPEGQKAPLRWWSSFNNLAVVADRRALAVQIDEIELHVPDGDEALPTPPPPDGAVEKPAMFSRLVFV